MKSFVIIILAGLMFAGCKSNDPVSNTNPSTSDYVKVNTIENGNTKFELWSATGNMLYYGYNDIGLKVFIGGTEKKSGLVYFQPKMFHFLGSPWHSSPVSSVFNYDTDKQLYTGYASFTMISDSNGSWFGYYNYNNESSIDSIKFTVTTNSTNQVRAWDDIVGGHTYVLSLIEPMNAKVGLNNITYLLHQTNNDKIYTEVNGAQMFIKTWMPTHGHGSSSNENPASIGSGKYTGKANFSMSGGWTVYDSIYYDGGVITRSPSPDFYFDVR